MTNSMPPATSSFNDSMPMMGATNSASDTTPNAVNPMQHGNMVHLQLYAVRNPARRIMPANPALGFNYPVALIEMALHSPSAAQRYAVTTVWVALPSNVVPGTSQGEAVNNITALPMWNAIYAKGSFFNSAIVYGRIALAYVPNLNWVQNTDGALPESQLMSAKKLSLSNVIAVETEGFVPTLTYDSTMAPEQDSLNYAVARDQFAQPDSSGAVLPLRPHSTVNHFSGYVSVGTTMPKVLGSTSINFGLHKGSTGDARNRFTTHGSVYRNGIDATGSVMVLDINDNIRTGSNGTSRSAAFQGLLSPTDDTAFHITGVLRAFPDNHSKSSFFRIQVTHWTGQSGSQQADSLQSKDNDALFDNFSLEMSAAPQAPASDSPWDDNELPAQADLPNDEEDENYEELPD